MKTCILMGSPRKNGNTASLTPFFMDELKSGGGEVDYIWLHDLKIEPCVACRSCQNDYTRFGCVISDDMQKVFDKVCECDLLVLATPIYSWFCPAPMKATLDRLVYGMNKYYGETKGPSLWKGKKCALLTTCGYPPEKGADLFEEGVKRYCKHSSLVYLGMLAIRDMGYRTEFLDSGKIQQARDFAQKLISGFHTNPL